MTRSNDRDDAVMERLLKGALGRGSPREAPRGTCLDAQTLAAWADDELDAKARAAAEAHAADCARCQALLAAMVRTEAAAVRPDFAARPWWRRPVVGWLVPVAAAATLVVAWVIVPRGPHDRVLPAESEIARKDALGAQPPPPASASTAKASSSAVESVRAANEPARPAEAKPAAPASDALADARTAPSAAPLQAPAPSASRQTRVEAPAPVAPAQTRADARETAKAQGALAETVTVAPAPRAGVAGGVPREPDRPAAAQRLAGASAFAPAVILSPDPDSRWRIAANGGVERSTDSGSTWALQQTGSVVSFTAGSSPSPLVCWLVGPNGAIVLSTDGATWRRIPFPEQTLLVAIRATDERSATVTTADGRMHTTTDAGATWAPTPPK